MKKSIPLCLALLGALALPAQAADKIKIGFISTLSGPGGVLGAAIRDGFNLALENTGGKVGGLPAEVMIEDDQQKPDVARQLDNRMIKRDKADLMTGIVSRTCCRRWSSQCSSPRPSTSAPTPGPRIWQGKSATRISSRSPG
jgi:hypothetical protein